MATARGFTDEQGRRYPALGRLMIPYSAARQIVSADHPERIVAPHDFIWDTDSPLDFDGHGTHVTGTIGQLTNDGIDTAGIAFNVKIMPVKTIATDWDFIFGALHFGTEDDVARATHYAVDNGARVLNMSIGGEGPSPVMEDAIKYAVGKGAFVAIAAGNGFEDGNPAEAPADSAPRIKGAVAVGAIDPLKRRAFYSATGSYVELVAPGGSNRGFARDGFVFQQTFNFNFTDTFLLDPAQYRAPRFDVIGVFGYIGTSMATPHVAALAAMLMQQGITEPAAIEDALEKYAIDLGPAGRDDEYGFGLIDARNTLRGLGLAK
jgi:serine protease